LQFSIPVFLHQAISDIQEGLHGYRRVMLQTKIKIETLPPKLLKKRFLGGKSLKQFSVVNLKKNGTTEIPYLQQFQSF